MGSHRKSTKKNPSYQRFLMVCLSSLKRKYGKTKTQAELMKKARLRWKKLKTPCARRAYIRRCMNRRKKRKSTKRKKTSSSRRIRRTRRR